MTTLLNGLLGGFAAALVATVLLRLLDADSLVVAVNGAEDTALDEGVIGNFVVPQLYGTVAGGALVALELRVLDVLSVPPGGGVALALALGWGAVLGALLAVLSRIWSAATPQSYRTLVLFHLSYGLALGLWIRITWIT